METMTLREQVARAIYEAVFIDQWYEAGEVEQALYLEAADAVLALLNGPNWRVVTRHDYDRMSGEAQP